jgi:hypothetical protein
MTPTKRRESAERILNEPAWAEAIESLHRFYYDLWRQAQAEERERIGLKADVLDDVIREIESFLHSAGD